MLKYCGAGEDAFQYDTLIKGCNPDQNRYAFMSSTTADLREPHPGLRHLRPAIQLAAERAADECAARKTGDRRLTAHAIGHAALATRAPRPDHPSFTSAVASGALPQRVATLLTAPIRRRRFVAASVAALLLAVGISSAGAGVRR